MTGFEGVVLVSEWVSVDSESSWSDEEDVLRRGDDEPLSGAIATDEKKIDIRPYRVLISEIVLRMHRQHCSYDLMSIKSMT